MDIYLDTSHLQKWQQRTLLSKDLLILDRLKNTRDNSFVISLAHIFDITDGKDTKKAISVAEFLDTLPIKWLRNAEDLKREELRNAMNCFRSSNQTQINPFVEHYVDTLEMFDAILEIRLHFRNASIKEIITTLISDGPQKQVPSLTKENLKLWSHANDDALKEIHIIFN